MEINDWPRMREEIAAGEAKQQCYVSVEKRSPRR